MARGGKRPCKACGEGHGNQPGGLCLSCFGQGVVPPETAVPPAPPLPDDATETDVQAMEALWLNEGRPRTKRQKSWVPLYKESPKAFRDRLDKLRSGSSSTASPDSGPGTAPTTSKPSWDGAGPCPTCHQHLDPITNDLGHERVEELLTEQFETVRLFNRHKQEFLAWLTTQPASPN